MAMPIDEQADEQTAQPQRNQPDGIQRRNLQHVAVNGITPLTVTALVSAVNPAPAVHRLPTARDTGNPAVTLYETKTETPEDGGGGKPRDAAGNQ